MTFSTNPPGPAQPIAEVVTWIVDMNRTIGEFWSEAHGWAPEDSASLLGRSRLDWQVELSKTLALWVDDDVRAGPMDDGPLILAWSNLGSLVEGTLKWFLSVYLDDYSSSIEGMKKAQPYPDTLTLEPLRQFFAKHVWTPSSDWNDWIAIVQSRRNAIHAYKDRPLGTRADFEEAVRTYARFLDDLDGSVPYP